MSFFWLLLLEKFFFYLTKIEDVVNVLSYLFCFQYLEIMLNRQQSFDKSLVIKKVFLAPNLFKLCKVHQKQAK